MSRIARLSALALGALLTLGVMACSSDSGKVSAAGSTASRSLPPTSTSSLTASGGSSASADLNVSSSVPAGSPTSSVSSSSENSISSSGGTVTVTQDNYRQTVTLRAGEHLVVQLRGSASTQWEVPRASDDGVIIRTSSQGTDGSQTATFDAVAAGEAVVTSTGVPMCASTDPCGALAQDFLVSVVVRG